jgi:hypothetical protein
VPELATLRIYRPKAWEAAGFTTVIEMDGREFTRLCNSGNWASYVEPGQHILRVRGWRGVGPPLELPLASGDDVQLELQIGVWTGRPFLARVEGGTTGPPIQPPGPPTDVQVLGVSETHRSEEPIGTETRRIDNTSGVGRVTRTIRVTEEWSRMVSLDLHARHNISNGIGVGPNWLAFKTSIERSLERTYAVSVNRREEFAEEIGVEIEPGADVTVILTWKRIWQHGLADVLTQGRPVNVPYRMAVGITFDQSIR